MVQARRRPRRQDLRRGVILFTFLLFPVVLNFLSPYLIVDSAAQGILNGSAVVFGLMFVSALLLGRLWCSWVCPGAGLMESCFVANSRRLPGGGPAVPDRERHQLCTKNCPMSLDVQSMVQAGKMENSECILCGQCIDGCAQQAIRYTFSRGR